MISNVSAICYGFAPMYRIIIYFGTDRRTQRDILRRDQAKYQQDGERTKDGSGTCTIRHSHSLNNNLV